METGAAMNRARDVLKEYFGYDRFRQGQEEAVEAILSGRDALCVMPTGAGKSLCYEIPAMVLNGITLVISPLVSLMKDQVRALTELSIPAAFCNSTLTAVEYRAVLRDMASGRLRIVYVAPERLDSPDFCTLCRTLPIALIAVDEAHCVSQWGQDFRPSYRRIAAFVDTLPHRPIVAAFTATAAENVRADVISLLCLRTPYTCVTGFDRPNLYFGVIRASKNRKQELLQLMQKYREKSGIVYCMTRKSVEEICAYLQENGYAATRYHAGLSEKERRENQDDFLYDRKTIMVATNAFGMGIDKSNVSFVVHYHMPKDMESYYQEAGRAGRDGAHADCILLFSPSDMYTNRSLITHSAPDASLPPELQSALLERSMHRLNDMYDYGNSTDCLRGRLLRYFGENGMQHCGNCSHCLTKTIPIDATVDAQKYLSCIIRTQSRYGAGTIIAILTGSKSEKIISAGLHTIRTYGIMQELDRGYLDWLTEQLILTGCMERTGDYNVLAVTDTGWQILRGERTLSLNLPDFIARTSHEKKQKKKISVAARRSHAEISASINVSPDTEDLYETLRIRRTELATDNGVPPYVVASNALLEEISRCVPQTEEEMLAVRGMGAVLYKKYGVLLLETVQEWSAEHSAESKRRPSAAAFVMPPHENHVSHNGSSSTPRSQSAWSEEEDRQLTAEVAEKMTLLRIAAVHERNAVEIFQRMRDLHLQ